VAAAEGEGGHVIRLAAAAALLALGCAAPAGACPITQVAGSYGNEFLEAVLPWNGRIVFRPGGAGFVDHDGALGIKLGWNRLIPGTLRVGGRRLDGDAPPARAYLNDGYGDRGLQPIYLIFPVPGCWEITGGLGDARLSFVLKVEKVGDGPGWKFDGLPPGWRMTNSPE
jgi:hypothetical protein